MITLARNTLHIKKRMDHMVWKSQTTRSIALRAVLEDHFKPFDRIAIIGGMVRDVARLGSARFSSDIDIVIDAPSEQVAFLARNLNAKANRFGGFGVKTPVWKVDFWALENTWASQHGYSKVNTLEDVIDTTFFDTDRAIYNIWDRKVICSDDYFDTLLSNRIEINLEPNPSIAGNILRAVRRLKSWNAQPGYKLIMYIDEHLNEEVFDYIKLVEKKIYTTRYIDEYRSAQHLKYDIIVSNYHNYRPMDQGKQLTLPF